MNNKNSYVPAIKKSETPVAYPDAVETGWKQQQSQPYVYRTNSQTDPVSEAYGFVVKYSVWGILSIVIAAGLALRNSWDAGTLLVVWGIIATLGYVVIFFVLSMFTPEGVAVSHEFFAYLRHRTDSNNNTKIELHRLDLRHEAYTASMPVIVQSDVPKIAEQPVAGLPVAELPEWTPSEDFVESIDLSGDKPAKYSPEYILKDFVISLYDNAETLLIDNCRINMQSGVMLPWSRRSDLSAETKSAMQEILDRINPPLFQSHSSGRVWMIDTDRYPTKDDAIRAIMY